MIKKRKLMEFIDAVEKKAVGSVEKRYQKVIDEEQSRILNDGGYTNKIEELQDIINSLLSKHRELISDMHDNKIVHYTGIGCWDTLDYEIRGFDGKGYIKKVLDKCMFDGGSVEKIRNKRDKEIQAVKDNYNKVRIICDRKANGSQIAEYLKGLGFDISSLEKDESKALTVEIDKSKLFVCGENK
jgi:hypothetical protein